MSSIRKLKWFFSKHNVPNAEVQPLTNVPSPRNTKYLPEIAVEDRCRCLVVESHGLIYTSDNPSKTIVHPWLIVRSLSRRERCQAKFPFYPFKAFEPLLLLVIV